MRRRDAARVARRFVRERYHQYAHWHLDLCEEYARADNKKAWSFWLTPDEEDEAYASSRTMVGYVHADGLVEGLY